VKLHGSRSPSRGERITMFLPADKIYLFDLEGNAIPVETSGNNRELVGTAPDSAQ
jgi:hypothetical protein